MFRVCAEEDCQRLNPTADKEREGGILFHSPPNPEFSEGQRLGKEEDKCIEDRFIPIILAISKPLYRPTKKHPRALFWETGGGEKVAVSESLVCATKAVRAGITAADRRLGEVSLTSESVGGGGVFLSDIPERSREMTSRDI